jgi:DNA-binding transcriptional MerR regulator
MPRRNRSRFEVERLTTAQAARALGISKRTLHNRIKAGKLTPPEVDPKNGYFVWTLADLEMARKLLEES